MIEIHVHRDEQLNALVPVASKSENRQIWMTTNATEIERHSMNETTENEVLLTAEEAAAEVGVSKSAIYVWTNRGYLKAAKKEGRFNYYRLNDVFEAEKNRNRKYRRKEAA